MYLCTRERFLKDVKNHRMEIIKDDGLYRHLRFSNGTFNMRFDIVTWPGHLCYTGDMGSYLFSRVNDMFSFFRGCDGKELQINTGYWAEKCLAAGVHDGISEYDSEEAVQTIRDILKEHQAPHETVEEVEDEILGFAENEYSLREAISNIENDTDHIFDDFWEVDLSIRPFRYVWCCYALVWAISMYDAGIEK